MKEILPMSLMDDPPFCKKRTATFILPKVAAVGATSG
jgi:hypothetical protein